jgi:predicted nucleic acid-binding Zn ribbon protein
MQTMSDIDQERRSKNIRLAWILAGAVMLIMISAVPFWQGLAKIALGN